MQKYTSKSVCKDRVCVCLVVVVGVVVSGDQSHQQLRSAAKGCRQYAPGSRGEQVNDARSSLISLQRSL